MSQVRPQWLELIPEEQWCFYRPVITGTRSRGIPFAIGGAFAVATHTGSWRNTKDLDLYVLPRDREATIRVLTEAGLSDYYEQLPYDRRWIYRGSRDGFIIDIIWAMANRRAYVDEGWLSRGPELRIEGGPIRVLPAEEMIWNKLFVLQRDRCDWPDCMNLIYAAGPTLDWEYLLGRMGEDVPLLQGALAVFVWLCPGRAQSLPKWLWDRIGLPAPPGEPLPQTDAHHIELLDSRQWFAA